MSILWNFCQSIEFIGRWIFLMVGFADHRMSIGCLIFLFVRIHISIRSLSLFRSLYPCWFCFSLSFSDFFWLQWVPMFAPFFPIILSTPDEFVQYGVWNLNCGIFLVYFGIVHKNRPIFIEQTIFHITRH